MTTILTLCFVLLATSVPCWAQETLRIATTESPPLSTPAHDGMLDRLVVEAFARAGYHVDIVPMPGERGLISVVVGDTDGDMNRIHGLESLYPDLVQSTESNMLYDIMVFSRRSDLVVRDWDDMLDYHVGYITGWKILEEHVRAKSLTKVDNPDQLFALLTHDRVDLIIFDRLGGEYRIRQHGLHDVQVIEPPLATREMFLYLHRRHQDLLPAYEEALRSMKTDGSHQRIFSVPVE